MSPPKTSVGWPGIVLTLGFVAYGAFVGLRNVNHGVDRSQAGVPSAPVATEPAHPIVSPPSPFAAAPIVSATPEHAPSQVLPSTQLFKAASPSVVRVVALDAREEPTKFGSGFFVTADGLFVTNYHVIQGAKALRAFAEGSTTPVVARVIATDPERDLSLLKVDGGGHVALPLATSIPAVGARVYAIGNPSGLTNTLSEGIVSGVRTLPGQTWIQTTAAISPGSSGGPLIAEDGRVVGVNTMGMRGGQSLNFAVDAGSVRRLIDGPRSEPSTAPAAVQTLTNVDPAQVLDEAFREAAKVKAGQGRAYKQIAELAARIGRADLCRQAALRARTTMDQRDVGDAAHKGEFEASLIQTLVRVRQWEAASQVAQAMTDASRRARELLAIADAARAAGDRAVADAARAFARTARAQHMTSTPAMRSQWDTLRPIAEALDDGDFDRAVALARGLKDTADPQANRPADGGANGTWNPRSRALLVCVAHAGAKDDPSRAAPVAQEIFDLHDRERALLKVVSALAAKDQFEPAAPLIAKLALPENVARGHYLLARARVKQGVSAEFKEHLRKSLEAAGKVKEPAAASVAMADFIECLIEANALSDAAAMAQRIVDSHVRDGVQRVIAIRQAKSGRADEALALAGRILAGGTRDLTYQHIAKEQADLGDYDGATRTTKLIHLTVWRPVAVRDIAIAQAGAGRYAEVRTTLLNTPTMSAYDRNQVYESLARTQAKAGLIKLASDSAAMIKASGTHAIAMAAIVTGCYAIQTPEEWLAWTDQSAAPEDRALMLASLAECMLDAAQAGGASTAAPTTRPLPPTKS